MKMAAEVRWLAALIALLVAGSVATTNQVHRKFEYKYSFKPPYLAQKDGSVPFWEYGGNAIASSENVRIAPSLRSQKGAIWTKMPVNDFEWWEVDLVFRISGRGRIGADGLAFWYTQSKGQYNGTVFGSSDQWNGLGIFFDSFDNDAKHNNPYIMAIVNDGTHQFDHANDGHSQTLAGCLKDFRNKPFATRAKIEYFKNTLTLLFHNGMTNSDQDYEMCFRAENVYLPKHGYFGVSAATGGLADDHDVLHFLTTSLHVPGDGSPQPSGHNMNSDEEAKIAKEFAEYQKKLEQQKEEYKKEHPDAHTGHHPESEEWYESDNQRELRQIFSGQAQMYETMRELNRKLDEILGRQERTLSLISQVQVGGVHVQGQHGGQPGHPVQLIDTIRREEVNNVLNNQNAILNAARDLRTVVGEINHKTETIMSHQARAPTAQVQPMGYDYQTLINEMRDGLNHVKRDIGHVNTKLGSQTQNCPETSCLTTTMLVVFMAIQLVIMLCYSLYKDNKEAQAKKFY